MERLTRAWLAKNNRNAVVDGNVPVKIMQFGEGNFLRAFVDWFFERLNASGRFSGSVQVIQPIRTGMAGELKKQDGVYTLLLRGSEKGKAKETREVVSVIRDILNPYEEWDRFIQSACEPELRFVVSNTTEAGIAYVPSSRPDDKTPESFPAKVAAILAARFNALGGNTERGLVFLPCELIEKNGDTLRDAVLRHLRDWECGSAVEKWVLSSCRFYNTLVDRIVTGYPAAEAAALCNDLGYEDKLIVAGELFHFWAIEGNPLLRNELPFEEIGLNVVVADDIKPYRDRKVRVLNGAHTGNVLAAFLAGLDTVGELMDDPLFGNSLREMVFNEILPGVSLPEDEKREYAEATLERFKNPFVRHELISIALNSVSKWKVRVLPSLKDYQTITGALPQRLVFSLAALLMFYHGSKPVDGCSTGKRNAENYPIRDSSDVLNEFSVAWNDLTYDLPALASRILSNTKLWDEDLTLVDGLVEMTAKQLHSIQKYGIRNALATIQ